MFAKQRLYVYPGPWAINPILDGVRVHPILDGGGGGQKSPPC